MTDDDRGSASPANAEDGPVEESREPGEVPRTARRRTEGWFNTAVPLPVDGTVTRLEPALKAQGFRVLSQNELHRLLHRDLGVTVRPYLVLLVSHPGMAYRTMANPLAATLLATLPITLQGEPNGSTRLLVADPSHRLGALDLEGDEEIDRLARELRSRLRRVVAELVRHSSLRIV